MNACDLYGPIQTAPQTLKTRQQSPVILDLCLRKTRADKSRDYRDVIVFEKLRFQTVFRPHQNAKMTFSNSSEASRTSCKV